jgi:hypothetical protein
LTLVLGPAQAVEAALTASAVTVVQALGHIDAHAALAGLLEAAVGVHPAARGDTQPAPAQLTRRAVPVELTLLEQPTNALEAGLAGGAVAVDAAIGRGPAQPALAQEARSAVGVKTTRRRRDTRAEVADLATRTLGVLAAAGVEALEVHALEAERAVVRATALGGLAGPTQAECVGRAIQVAATLAHGSATPVVVAHEADVALGVSQALHAALLHAVFPGGARLAASTSDPAHVARGVADFAGAAVSILSTPGRAPRVEADLLRRAVLVHRAHDRHGSIGLGPDVARPVVRQEAVRGQRRTEAVHAGLSVRAGARVGARGADLLGRDADETFDTVEARGAKPDDAGVAAKARPVDADPVRRAVGGCGAVEAAATTARETQKREERERPRVPKRLHRLCSRMMNSTRRFLS